MRTSVAGLVASVVAGALIIPASLVPSASAADWELISLEESPATAYEPSERPLTTLDAEGRQIDGMTNEQVRDLLAEMTVDRENDTDNIPAAAEEVSARATSAIRGKTYDSKIPTYDYTRIWFNKRATYLIGHYAIYVSVIAAAIGVFVRHPVATTAAGLIGIGTTITAQKASNAQNDKECLAFSFYHRKSKYLGVNLPGPEVSLRTIYQTDYNCTGRYGN